MKLFPNLTGPSRTVAQTVTLVLVMGSLAWASVPFYDWFCRVTGFGGATNVAEAGSDVILDETITVRFDASLARDMPWTFKPESVRWKCGSVKRDWPSTRRTTDRSPGSGAGGRTM